MLKRLFILVLLIGSLVLLAGVVLADETDPDADYPWLFHAEPFAFKFGNKIDSHQQSRIVDGGRLQGFLYIHDVHDPGDLAIEDLPVAEPAKCPHMEDCRVGWILKGVPISATLVNKSPRIWLVDPADLPTEPGYNHFHWLGEPKTPSDLVVGQEYPGILLKRIAPEPFYWLGGGGGGGSGGGSCGGHDGGDTGGCSHDTGDTSGCDSGSTGDTGCSHDTGDTGGCDSGSTGDTGCSHDTSDTGGCDSGSTGDTGCSHDTGDTGGCDSGSTGDTGCSHDTGDTGGCDSGSTGDTGCSHDTGDTGGCGGSGGMGGPGGSGGHGGRVVEEGVDSHTNIVTDWDGTWGGGGGCGGHDDGGCTGHDGSDPGGCDGGDTGSDPGGCSGTDGGSCTG